MKPAPLVLSLIILAGPALAQAPQKALKFPVDNSVGEIFRVTDMKASRGKYYSHKFQSRAMGLVGISPDWKLSIRFNPTIIKYVQVLKTMPVENVYSMGFDYANVKDEHAADILRFRQLRELDIANTELSDSGVAKFAALEKLVYLDASHTEVKGACLFSLAGAKCLSSIDLGFNDIEGKNLAALKDLKTLKYLNLNKCHLRSDDLAYLVGCKNLEYLDLRENHLVSDKGMAALAKLKNLRTIDLRNTNVTAAGVLTLKNLPLETIRIESKSLKEGQLAQLKSALPKTKFHVGNKMKSKLGIFKDVTGIDVQLP